MKIVTVIGARPQFIKAGAFSRYIKNNSNVTEIIVHTGQHYDKNMSDIFFEELEIPKPQYHLNIGSGSHASQTAEMMRSIEKVLIEEKPDVLLVYGDTNSTLAGALTASKLHIPVAHVEAGLRSFNMFMPEEQNRILTDHLSSFLFCPTKTAISHLKNENIYDQKKGRFLHGDTLIVKNSGDIMYDAVLFNSKLSRKKSKILEDLKLKPQEYLLSTIHRAENTDFPDRLKDIFAAFSDIEEKIVLTLHPRTKKYIAQYDISVSKNVMIIDPVGYLDMLSLESQSKMIVTDSGGIQKEAYFMKVPCITMRDETEWVETIESGWNFLTSSDREQITSSYALIKNGFDLNKLQIPFFGDGNSAKKIIENIILR